MPAEARSILEYWFGSAVLGDCDRVRRVWFQKDPAFDAALRDRFGEPYQRGAAGDYDHWQVDPLPCLALVVLLDQFSRNLFRDRPAAFASDAKAREVAATAIAAGHDQAVPPVARLFFYLPFEHSESLADQGRSVALFESLCPYDSVASTIEYAHRHRDVIRRFGRFPHRNAILGRTSTPGEVAFLQQPGSSF